MDVYEENEDDERMILDSLRINMQDGDSFKKGAPPRCL